jgi:hypothetical protein
VCTAGGREAAWSLKKQKQKTQEAMRHIMRHRALIGRGAATGSPLMELGAEHRGGLVRLVRLAVVVQALCTFWNLEFGT